MKLAIAVQGRFHAFDLARALIELGHDVQVFTNYPPWAVARFGIPQSRVRGFAVHGVLTRALDRLQRLPFSITPMDSALHVAFGRWARRQIARESWDVVHTWSGVSEEVLNAALLGSPIRYVMRGSSHIRTQNRLLREEELRSGARQDHPTPWRIAREEREYDLADAVVTLSTFARDSFVDEGFPPESLRFLPLGANLASFRPADAVVAERRWRILTSKRLRVLFVGTLSFRKGFLDLDEAMKQLGTDRFEFRLVGAQAPEIAPLLKSLQLHSTLTPKVAQSSLPEVYAWGDVFVFPTIEDGFAQVLVQAAASGLPILTTPNSSGPDFIHEGESGWIVPIRDPASIVTRLLWCQEHRRDLATMADRVYADFRPRDWRVVAEDFERIITADLLALRKESHSRRGSK